MQHTHDRVENRLHALQSSPPIPPDKDRILNRRLVESRWVTLSHAASRWVTMSLHRVPTGKRCFLSYSQSRHRHVAVSLLPQAVQELPFFAAPRQSFVEDC